MARLRVRSPSIHARIKAFLAEHQMREMQARLELQRLIDAGPQPGSKVTPEAWRNWHQYGFVACPHTRKTCDDGECRLGAACKAMQAYGLAGDGSALPRKQRPACGVRNRRGVACSVRVEPGKRRCRFHGGLSTGPKTAAGKARISAANRARWARYRASQGRISQP
jgi:hypothetical protein